MSFQDKVAIVTGGGRDIGRAVSIKLAAAGARVCLNYANDEASAQETLALIKAAGGQAIAHRADVTDPAAVAGLVAATQAAFGQRIDVLVNVAGGMVERRPLADIDPAFFHKVIDLNLTSTYLTTHAVVPHMGEGAAIVNFASQAGRDGGGPGAAIYATAKAAVMTFTRAMAKELASMTNSPNRKCVRRWPARRRCVARACRRKPPMRRSTWRRQRQRSSPVPIWMSTAAPTSPDRTEAHAALDHPAFPGHRHRRGRPRGAGRTGLGHRLDRFARA